MKIYSKLFFLFCFIIESNLLFSQCDTLVLEGKYKTYNVNQAEYYGDFNLVGKNQNGIFRLDDVEKNISLDYSFTVENLNSTITQCKFLMKNNDGSSCLFPINVVAEESDISVSGVGTGTDITTYYYYFDKKIKVFGQYFPPEKTDIDTTFYKDINFYFPTAISPNQDDINDEFRVYASENVLIDNIEIFDRWGALRYKRQNIFSDEIRFTAKEKLNQSDLFVGFIVFKNKILKPFSFSVVEN